MKYARFFSISVFIVMALYGMVGFYFLPLASFEGNLTRMGEIPESMFGWNKKQPAVNPALLQQSSWQDADVLAIGDSFTAPLLWQTALTRRGLKVHTETWKSVGNICGDFSEWLRNKGFKGRYVVIELVEFGVTTRLDRSVACKHMLYHDLPEIHAPAPPTLRPHPSSLGGRLSVGIQTELNLLKYERLRKQPGFTGFHLSHEVWMRRVPDGCELFSHLSCNDALFFSRDHIPDFNDSTLNQIQTINNRLHKLIPIWVIIPDKTTAYLNYHKKFWDKAERRFSAPNVLKAFRQAIQNKTVDFYPANNTHVSTTGYLLLGETIYKSIQRQSNIQSLRPVRKAFRQ
jgi:hypothetical protein